MRADNLILNGGFETGDFTYWGHPGAYIGSKTGTAGGAFGLPITIPTHSGNYAAALGGGGTSIYQSFVAIPGDLYELTYWVDASLPYSGDVLNAKVITSDEVSTLRGINGDSSTNDTGYQFYYNFFSLSSASPAEIGFVDEKAFSQALNSGSPLFPFLVDDVHLYDDGPIGPPPPPPSSSTPEPAGAVLALSSLGALGLFRARRKASRG